MVGAVPETLKVAVALGAMVWEGKTFHWFPKGEFPQGTLVKPYDWLVGEIVSSCHVLVPTFFITMVAEIACPGATVDCGGVNVIETQEALSGLPPQAGALPEQVELPPQELPPQTALPPQPLQVALTGEQVTQEFPEQESLQAEEALAVDTQAWLPLQAK